MVTPETMAILAGLLAAGLAGYVIGALCGLRSRCKRCERDAALVRELERLTEKDGDAVGMYR